jgi:hypothetical protein
MTYENRDTGHGVVQTFDHRGDVIACHTIINHCAGCGKPLTSGENRHDGPSGNARKGWSEVITQAERERIERIKWELDGGWEGFEGRLPAGWRKGG